MRQGCLHVYAVLGIVSQTTPKVLMPFAVSKKTQHIPFTKIAWLLFPRNVIADSYMSDTKRFTLTVDGVQSCKFSCHRDSEGYCILCIGVIYVCLGACKDTPESSDDDDFPRAFCYRVDYTPHTGVREVVIMARRLLNKIIFEAFPVKYVHFPNATCAALHISYTVWCRYKSGFVKIITPRCTGPKVILLVFHHKFQIISRF